MKENIIFEEIQRVSKGVVKFFLYFSILSILLMIFNLAFINNGDIFI